MIEEKMIATLGYRFDKNDRFLLRELLECGIDYFRINLSKINDIETLKYKIDLIKFIRYEAKRNVKIMLDLPYPGKKPRFFITDSDKIYLAKNEKIIITSDQLYKGLVSYKIVYTDVSNIGKLLKTGDLVIYGDGECSFYIDCILDESTVLACANCDALIFSTKSISFGYINYIDKPSSEYIRLLQSINAYSVALSFVQNTDELDFYINSFPQSKIISKIENLIGIKNVDSISAKTDIMLGRGDICLNADIYSLYLYQKQVSESAKKNNISLYFATGFLSSLCVNNFPSQSDIIDISNALLLEPDYLILNYGLVSTNCRKAVQVIKEIEKRLINNPYNASNFVKNEQ